MKRIFSFFTVITVLTLSTALAQNTSYKIAAGSQVIIEGTSTVHDWSVEIDKLQSGLVVSSGEDAYSILNTTIDIKVDDLKSGKGRMDRLMHSALKKDAHPAITFRLDPARTTLTGSNGTMTVTVTGSVNIAGVERMISLNLDGKRNADQTVQFTGYKDLKMSDFKVDPPTAMLGTIRSGNDITIRFDLRYSPVN
ncbi:MAG: YceI family protein [Balneolales bacterium]